MKINLQEIKTFVRCPRLFRRSKEIFKQPRDRLLEIAVNTIKKCCIRATETGHRADWRQIVGWVDTEVFTDVNIDNQEAFTASKLLAEHVLLSIQSWYNRFHLQEGEKAYINCPLRAELDSNFFYSTIDIILLSDPVKVYIFTREPSLLQTTIYNNIYIRSLGWLVAHNLGSSNIIVRVCSIGDHGGFTVLERELQSKDNQRVKEYLIDIAKGIRSGISYPIITSDCPTCSLYQKCKL